MSSTPTATFSVNQIVRGVRCGAFIILGFRDIGGEPCAQVKEVNPADHTQVGRGEFAMPLDALLPW